MTAEQIFGALIIAFLIWLGRSVLQFAKEMTEWRVILFGQNGANGINGTVKDHENRIRWLESGDRAA